MPFPIISDVAALFLRKRFFLLTVSLSLGLMFLLGGEQVYDGYIERNWQRLSVDDEQHLVNHVQSQYSIYESETVDAVEEIARFTPLRLALSQPSQKTQSELFVLLFSQHRNRDLSFDLYDAEKHLLCWSGNRKPVVDTSKFLPHTMTFIVQGAIYSYLVVITPVMTEQSPGGYLVGKRLFDVNYPINNRFINNAAFITTFSSRLDISAEFDCSSDATASPDTNIISISLKNLIGKSVGYAFLARPVLSGRIEKIHEIITGIVNLVLLFFMVTIMYHVVVWSKSKKSSFVRVVYWSVAIWLIRYTAIWTNFPAGVIHLKIFEPDYFASPFGFGLARSLGDVFLSSICIFLNTIIVVYVLLNERHRRSSVHQGGNISKKLISAVYIAIVVILLLMSMRGFSATIHSAVFDSALSYNDPTSVLPSHELAIMLVSLFLIALSLVVAAVGLISLAAVLVQRIFISPPRKVTAWLTIGIILFFSSFIFGVAQENPLMSQGIRLLYLSLFTILALWFSRDSVFFKVRDAKGKAAMVLVVAAFLTLVPLLDNKVHELDRAHVELLASEIVRPADAWLTFLLNRALDELSGVESARILSTGDPDDIEKLAFTQWAKSILSREGNNCSVTFVNWDGTVVSDFHLGVAPHRSREHVVESSPGRRTIHVEEKSHNGTGERWYVGYAPISVDRNPSIGGVWVELSGSRQTLLRGEASEILMNYSREKFETHYRTLILSEYFKGKLITTTNERIPLGRPLPIALQNITNRSNGTWMNDIIDSKSYETLFLPEQSNSSDDGWIALSMEELDLRWHLYSFLRYILFYLILVGVMIAAILMVRWHRGENLTISFRSKLMLAFIIMSLIPIIIVAYYNRQYVMEQAGESSIRRLSDQTSVFVSELEHHYEIDVPAALAQLTDERCAEIANDLNADFNVYYGSSLQASSKSEMFTAELLDPSISAEAYMNIVLQRKSFFTETQTIGTLPYVVGYRPLIAQNGSIFGVVSVPTLYRQTEIDEELTRRNVFLYGAYAIALALSLGVGTILANQISSPIRRLKQATQQIAAGRMDVDLASDRSDEIGELEDAFKQMTKDLQQTQAQMVKAQRELAWKEMAKQVAHEIKNPLTPIKLSVQHLRQAYHDRAKNFDSLLQQVSETILAQIDALSRIASEFSHFARLPERFLVEANVNDVLLEAKNLFQQHAQVQFVEKYANLQPLVIVDRDELRRAFINVIRNAIQAMEERGTITLQTLIDEDAVQIVVLDTGPGIPEEMQEHLFEPNFSTKTDGMGLGLAIVKKIITDLGGTITIEAGERGGTLVRMHLPIAKGSKTLTQPGTVNNA